MSKFQSWDLSLYFSMCACICDCLLIVVAVLFPPLPVWIICGFCSAESLINVALFFLGYFPGLFHSWYIIASRPIKIRHTPVAVYYVYHDDIESQVNAHPGPLTALHPPRHHASPPPHVASYGAIENSHPLPHPASLTTPRNALEPRPPQPSCDPSDQPPPSYHEGDHKLQR